MHRQPHEQRDDKKVWLSASEVATFLDVDDTTRRLAYGLGLRSGLRSGEIVGVTPDDVARGPQGEMVRVRESVAKGGKYRETPLPPSLATTIRTVADVREEPSDAPLVDISTRTLRRWISARGDALADETGEDGWRDVTAHDFRRTWATLLAGTDGVDALLVCQWGGWEDLETFLDHYHGAHSPEVQRRARESVEWL